MSHRAEINKRIVRKIQAAETEQRVKDFLLEILQFEGRMAQRERVKFSDDYMKLIEKYFRPSKGGKKV